MASPRQSLPLDLLLLPALSRAARVRCRLSCDACALEFPELDGVPCLLADPAAVLGDWRARSHAFLAELDAQAGRYRAALGPSVTRATTRNRLKLLAAACTDHARRLRALLAPLGLGAAAAPELYRALGVSLPSSQGLTSYYANLHRDWCWGEAENEASFRLARRRARGLGHAGADAVARRRRRPAGLRPAPAPASADADCGRPQSAVPARRAAPAGGRGGRTLRVPDRAARHRQPRDPAQAAGPGSGGRGPAPGLRRRDRGAIRRTLHSTRS